MTHRISRYYIVTVHGASGGKGFKASGSSECSRDSGAAVVQQQGGRGASAHAVFKWDKGTKLSTVIGQEASRCTNTNCGGGGGGGTFVWDADNDTSVFLVAGGGGGASHVGSDHKYWGADGSEAKEGTGSRADGMSGYGGSNGEGGYQYDQNDIKQGGGGGGWVSGGKCSFYRHTCGSGKDGYFVGGSSAEPTYASGGFGGGAAGAAEGGGGGGFSGGGGGRSAGGGGGGGGSYLYENAVYSGAAGGIRVGGGQLEIRQLEFEAASAGAEPIFLTTCGSQGAAGPTKDQCSTAYSYDGRLSDIEIDSETTPGVQSLVIPSSGKWKITAYGAAGGFTRHANGKAGAGASAEGQFNLKAGEVLNVAVGQHGGTIPFEFIGKSGGKPSCNEADWPDQDKDAQCGACKVLVQRFNTFYQTCDNYCASIGRECVAAFEDVNNGCEVAYEMDCGQTLGSSDAICQCSANGGIEGSASSASPKLTAKPGNVDSGGGGGGGTFVWADGKSEPYVVAGGGRRRLMAWRPNQVLGPSWPRDGQRVPSCNQRRRRWC